MAAIDRDHERLVAEIIALTQIPAPPFKEDKRGAAYLEMLRAHGLTDVERDEIGNVMGRPPRHRACRRARAGRWSRTWTRCFRKAPTSP